MLKKLEIVADFLKKQLWDYYLPGTQTFSSADISQPQTSGLFFHLLLWWSPLAIRFGELMSEDLKFMYTFEIDVYNWCIPQ